MTSFMKLIADHTTTLITIVPSVIQMIGMAAQVAHLVDTVEANCGVCLMTMTILANNGYKKIQRREPKSFTLSHYYQKQLLDQSSFTLGRFYLFLDRATD